MKSSSGGGGGGGGGWGKNVRQSSRVQLQRFTQSVLSSAHVRCSAREKGVVAALHGVSPVWVPAFLPPPLRADRVGVADGVTGILSPNFPLPSATQGSPAKTTSDAKMCWAKINCWLLYSPSLRVPIRVGRDQREERELELIPL